jgi:hypothetical protein
MLHWPIAVSSFPAEEHRRVDPAEQSHVWTLISSHIHRKNAMYQDLPSGMMDI